MNSVAEAVTKLQLLSEGRAGEVIALINDLAELEARENEADLKAARASLAEPGENIPLEKLAKDLGV